MRSATDQTTRAVGEEVTQRCLDSSRKASAIRTLALPVIGALLLVGFVALAPVSGAAAAATPVPLATAASFGVLAGTGIINTGPTTVTGDVGTFPTATVTGAASLTISGTNHAGDGVTQQAKTDLTTGYTNAAGQGPGSPIVADLGGQTLTPGVYNSASSVGLTGDLTLNAAGNPDAVFIFQAGSTLTTGSASKVLLTNGANACNVFWQVGSSATLGTGSTFRGTILALTSITVASAVTVEGRVLARNGAVTLDSDTISRPSCAATTESTTTSVAPTSTAVATTTAAPKSSARALPKAVNAGTGGQAADGASPSASLSENLALVALLVALSIGGALVVRRRR